MLKIKQPMMSTVLLCLALAFLGVPVLSAASSPNSNKHKSTAKAEVSSRAQGLAREQRKQIVSEALSALDQTVQGLKELGKKRKRSAIKVLEKAIGKLEVALSRDPSVALLPVSVDSKTFETVGTARQARMLVGEAKSLLAEGLVQDARRLLQNLASETVISTTSLPLATYPQAIKRAVSFVDKNKFNQAKLVLEEALASLVVTKLVIPLPIAKATFELELAETLAENKNRTEEENETLKALLDSAEGELRFAVALGYGSKKDLKVYFKEIKKIQKKTSKGKSGEGFFSKIKSSLKSIMKASQKK